MQPAGQACRQHSPSSVALTRWRKSRRRAASGHCLLALLHSGRCVAALLSLLLSLSSGVIQEGSGLRTTRRLGRLGGSAGWRPKLSWRPTSGE